MRRPSRVAVFLLACAAAGPAIAEAFAGAPVTDDRLATMRGGFDDGRGLRASFGIERVVTINGLVVAAQSVHIDDLGRISGEQAARLSAMLGSTTLVRNGPGNAAAWAGAPALAGATVIQNTLDGQTIKSALTIDASTNSLRALQGINAAGALRDALTAPLSPRP